MKLSLKTLNVIKLACVSVESVKSFGSISENFQTFLEMGVCMSNRTKQVFVFYAVRDFHIKTCIQNYTELILLQELVYLPSKLWVVS